MELQGVTMPDPRENPSVIVGDPKRSRDRIAELQAARSNRREFC